MKILLLGLGRANIAVARYLLTRGVELFLYEEHPEHLSPEAQILFPNHGIAADLTGRGDYELAISSPGFPDNAPVINALRARRVPVIDEIEFTYRELDHPSVIAVTGTNGKSTTAALISSIITQAGFTNFLGGNLAPGRPFSQALFEPRCDHYVLEVSSFQLTRTDSFHPRIAVLTNIGIDHLNWHRDQAEYLAAKARLFRRQTIDDTAVLNAGDDAIRRLSDGIKARIIWFGEPGPDNTWANGHIWYRGERLMSADNLPLIGRHNLMNILAAIAAAKSAGAPADAIEKGIRAFPGLPHRLEDLGIIAGVRYINNSMCTNEAAAIHSFQAVPGAKIVIAGGRSKGHAGHSYLDLLVREAKACILLGDNATEIESYFKSRGYTQFAVAHTMAEAVALSRSFAAAGDTIILNPGYASFGLFRDFQDRGEAFKHAVIEN